MEGPGGGNLEATKKWGSFSLCLVGFRHKTTSELHDNLATCLADASDKLRGGNFNCVTAEKEKGCGPFFLLPEKQKEVSGEKDLAPLARGRRNSSIRSKEQNGIQLLEEPILRGLNHGPLSRLTDMRPVPLTIGKDIPGRRPFSSQKKAKVKKSVGGKNNSPGEGMQSVPGNVPYKLALWGKKDLSSGKKVGGVFFEQTGCSLFIRSGSSAWRGTNRGENEVL